jgi:hypothetical protein
VFEYASALLRVAPVCNKVIYLIPTRTDANLVNLVLFVVVVDDGVQKASNGNLAVT